MKISNNYIKCFEDYNKKIEELNSTFNFINNKKKIDLSALKLTDSDKEYILYYLARKNNFNMPAVCYFEDVLDIAFDSKAELLNNLQELLSKTTYPDSQEKIKKLIEIVFDKAAKDSHIVNGCAKTRPARSWKYPYNGSQAGLEFILDKIYANREFMFKKALNSDYLPTVKPNEFNPYGYDYIESDYLFVQFTAPHFYNFTPEQIKDLSQAVVTRLCEFMSTPPCRVEFEDFNRTGYVTDSFYDVNKGCIRVNKNFLSKFQEAKEQNNPVFPLKLFMALVSMVEHRVIMSTLDDIDTFDRAYDLVSQCTTNPTCKNYLENEMEESLYQEYITGLDELNGRNAAFEYLRDLAGNPFILKQSDTDKVAAFYNKALDNEQRLLKAKYTDEIKYFFPAVFSKKRYLLKDHDKAIACVDKAFDQTNRLLKTPATNENEVESEGKIY